MGALSPWLEAGPGRESERVCVVAEVAPPGASPRFPGSTGVLAHHFILRGADAADRAASLLAAHRVSAAWFSLRPAPPPFEDLAPETPEFDQIWQRAAPDGFGFDEAAGFPGGRGENVTIVDVEFGWDDTHEDLTGVATRIGGEPDAEWDFHGTGVLGILAAGDDGFGVLGGAPAASVLVQHPYFAGEGGLLEYDVARAIVEATAVLVPGDVILVEQQAYGLDTELVPVSIDPGVRDAIRAATAAGVVVIEPAANDAVDLDDPVYEGAFAEDTGVLRVGGGSTPSDATPRSRYGSDWGGLVPVQGWAHGIVSTGGPPYVDLFFPGDDPRQAYTSEFGGTSGASALVAAVVAVTQSVAIATRGAPLEPLELRALLVSTGWAAAADSEPIGSLPDLRRLLRAALLP